jgi:hypothetical protein
VPHDRDARVARALAEAHFIQTLLGPHESAESTLAVEVRRLHGAVERLQVLTVSWRNVAAELRADATRYRAVQGDGFAWHAARAESNADILETQATLVESILGTLKER